MPNFRSWKILQDDGQVADTDRGEDENRVTLQMVAVEKSRDELNATGATSLMPGRLINGPDERRHIATQLVILKTSENSSF